MKRLLSLLAVITALCCCSGVFGQKPVYIYRNEGIINTFITEEIDSITYSRYDADSIMRQDYCTADIYACDSVYRIPLSSIDSISFVTPTTILKPDVFSIDQELLPWVTGRDRLKLYLSVNTPGNILPKKGEIIVSLGKEDTPLKNVFLGEVSDIRSENGQLLIECEPCYLEDAFIRLYSSSDGLITDDTKADSRGSAYISTGWKVWDPNEVKINLLSPTIPLPAASVAYEVKDNLAVSMDVPEISFSIKPKIKYHASLTFDSHYGTSVSLSVIGEYLFQERFALSGNVELSNDIALIEPFVPFACGLGDIFLEVGIYNRASLGIVIDKSWNQHYGSVFHWDWSSNFGPGLKSINDFKCLNNSSEGNFAINGNLGTGFYCKVGAKFIPTKNLDIAEVDLRYEAGIGAEGSFLPFKSDAEDAKTSPRFYNKLRNEKIMTYLESSAKVEASLFKWGVSTPDIPFLTGRAPLSEISIVPKFSNTRLSKNSGNTVFAQADVKGVVGSNDLGFALSTDGEFAENDYVYTHNTYRGPNTTLSHIFHNKSPESNYTAFPLIKWMGIEMIANKDESCTDDFHPHNVDLGLPSGIKWCCVNVGASDPTDAGEYYKGFSGKDIATEIMGKGYSTPTLKQFEELCDNTVQIRSTVNGVEGFIFRATNGNSIFLPAVAQLWWDGEESSWVINNEGSGAYWTKTVSDEDYLYFLEFNHEESKPFFGDRQRERNRLPIRPVYIEQ